MCPVTLSVVAIAATLAATVVQQQSARSAADAQEAFQNARFEQTQANANASFFAQAAAENLRIQQTAEATAQRVQDTNKQRARAQSAAIVTAGESGVSGISVDALLGEFDRTAALRNEAARRNFGFSELQAEKSKEGFAAQAAGRAISALPSPVNRPSDLAFGLNIGSQLIAGGNQLRGQGAFGAEFQTAAEKKTTG